MINRATHKLQYNIYQLQYILIKKKRKKKKDIEYKPSKLNDKCRLTESYLPAG